MKSLGFADEELRRQTWWVHPTALPCALRAPDGAPSRDSSQLLFYRKDQGEIRTSHRTSSTFWELTCDQSNCAGLMSCTQPHQMPTVQFIPPKRRVCWALGREDWFSSQSESHSIHLLQSTSSRCSRGQWHSGHRPHLGREETSKHCSPSPCKAAAAGLGTNTDFSYLRQL